MRKVLIIGLFGIVFCNTAFAQYVRYGIVSGIDISNFDVNYPIEYDKGYTDYRYKIGYRVALTLEYMMIPDVLHLATEIAFTQRGAKQTQTDSIYSKYTYNINYFQMPVNILYKMEIQDDTKFFVFTGPYIAYAISGKRKSDNKLLRTGQTWKYELKYQFGTELKSFDLGYNVGFGLEYFDYLLKIQYNYSMINLLYGEGPYQKNRNFGISVGILF